MTAVEVGRAFETIVHRRLATLGCALTANGGAFDQCVDLSGKWALPLPFPQPLWPGDLVKLHCHHTGMGKGVLAPLTVPMVVQCKATKKPVGVSTVREFSHAVAARFPQETLGVIATTGGFALRALQKEREWTLRDTLLLHMTSQGALVNFFFLSAAYAERGSSLHFISSPLVSAAAAPLEGGG
jgi:hypothetical protein